MYPVLKFNKISDMKKMSINRSVASVQSTYEHRQSVSDKEQAAQAKAKRMLHVQHTMTSDSGGTARAGATLQVAADCKMPDAAPKH